MRSLSEESGELPMQQPLHRDYGDDVDQTEAKDSDRLLRLLPPRSPVTLTNSCPIEGRY